MALKRYFAEFWPKILFALKKRVLAKLSRVRRCFSGVYERLRDIHTKNPHFKKIGKRMYDSWRLSLSYKSIKEIDNDTIRAWK